MSIALDHYRNPQTGNFDAHATASEPECYRGKGPLPMSSSHINTVLNNALDAPDSQTSLKRFLDKFYQKHPNVFIVEHGEPEERLSAMLHQYVLLLPILLAEANTICDSLERSPAMAQLSAILDQFFAAIDPQRLDYGMVGVLDKVYFGQRLLEELHDRLRLHSGRPLLSWDMALANLMVHTLIGDAYANRLDLAGMEIIDGLPGLAGPVDKVDTLVTDPDRPWPCLAQRHGLKMVFA